MICPYCKSTIVEKPEIQQPSDQNCITCEFTIVRMTPDDKDLCRTCIRTAKVGMPYPNWAPIR